MAECEELRDLVLSPNATDIEFLRRLPNLERISYKSTQRGPHWTPSQTAEEFWNEYDAADNLEAEITVEQDKESGTDQVDDVQDLP